MKVNFYLLIFGYVICQVSSDNTFAYHNTEQAYQFLIENQDELILGQWTASSEHLVYLNIVFDNKNLLLQVYPRQNNDYGDTHYFRLSYSLSNSSYHFDSVKKRMTWNNTLTEVTLQSNKESNHFQCSATIQLEIQKSQNSKNLNIYSEFEEGCQMNEERLQLLMFNNSKYSLDLQSYTALIICISLFQIINSHYYLNSDCVPNQGGSLTISIILTQDIYICIFSSLLFDTPRFYYFIPCLLSQLITILCDLKMKAKLTQTENYSKKDILVLIIEMTSTSFLFLQIKYWYGMILLNLFLLPQIIFTFFTGNRQKFNFNYLGTIFPRVLLSLYFTAYSNNILLFKYNLIVVGIVLLISITQFILYFCQCQYGLFILQTMKFNYFVKSTEDHSQLDCSICLDNLKNTSESYNVTSEEPVLVQTLNMATQKQLLMNTPCNHVFHPSCLIQWMQINLTCPLCKSSLPQIC
ncbi:unnamed protein product (macronuclear) [Paramecium tetraurelia]|uniref:RING-type E3 ubiquitin transferase n=1 Tax=Paramecium tetraurelia TaxID=5888 RepID=A0BWP3_PARTE|nr:uncharacterized protein GSPATT00032812001 [Paramecium tetraurelia]CAK62960.1 unnamed protein product [Paramecium tetraurelia]|eukprot:XP_001430358.1 hypothetical protein (macronuclear) [Paramecium tetraurelia strain d4-2]